MGYYARKDGDGQTTILSGSSVSSADQIIGEKVAGISTWPYYTYTTNKFICVPDSIQYRNVVRESSNPNNQFVYTMVNLYPSTTDTYTYVKGTAGSGDQASYTYPNQEALTLAESKFKSITDELHTNSRTVISWNGPEDTAKFLALNGSTVLDTNTNKLFRINLVRQNDVSEAAIPLNSSLDNSIAKALDWAGFIKTSATRPEARLSVVGETYKIELSEIPNYSTNYSIGQGRLITSDAPYDIFAIPYSDTFKFSNGTDTITCSKSINMGIAADLAANPLVYDIQLLPYCPFDTSAWPAGTYTDTTAVGKTYTYITQATTNTNVGVIFNVTSSNRNFTIAAPRTPYLQPTNLKLASCTTFARLVSPNYNGDFQFTPARNQGVSYFTVDTTLKPYQPYIHVAPAWGGLYGTITNRPMGLICSGDFGLPRISDEWRNYQLNNKNYQEIFDRQVKNMETNYNVAREQEKWSVIAGTGTGAAAGVGAGFMVGGPAGAAVGASAGLISGLAGLADRELNEQLRGEALDYTRDQFGYQMGNIKARPNTLTKVGALNANNKLWPIIEIWTCTEQELKAVAAKIALNGMSVGVVDKLGTWIGNNWTATVGTTTYSTQNYIKAKLVRIKGLNDESHYARALANELNQGVYWVANGTLLPLMEDN